MLRRLSNYTGNTPLIPITIGNLTVWGKAEFMNPSGSVKDRMATYILNDAEKRGLIKQGDTLIEATSGNTGIAFAMLAAERGYNMKWFNCNQFHNPINIQAHYETTGPEIHEEWSLPKIKGSYRTLKSPDVFIAGTGTGGTLMGVRKFLKEKWSDIAIVAVEPAESPVMSGGEPGLHGIQGIGDGSKFLVDLDVVDDIRVVGTDCAKIVAKHLAKKYGLFVGISAGSNVFAAFQWLRDNNKTNAITILCDRGDRYLSCL